MIVPIVSLFILIFILPIQVKSSSPDVNASVEIALERNIGFLLILIRNIALEVLAVLNFQKAGTTDSTAVPNITVPKIPTENFHFEKVSEALKTGVNTMKNTAQNITEQANISRESKHHTKFQEEVLTLIKELHAMKENGILTDDEFNAKKSELLENI